MNIWLVTIGEPIINPENKLRLHRTGILAKYISEQTNHNVIFWTSTFSHFTKRHLYNKDTRVEISNQLKIVAIHGVKYKRNISIARIINHRQIATKFRTFIKKEAKPDIIVVSFPTLELCEAAIYFGKSNKIPVLLDYRDMWPEVFVDVFPKGFRFIMNKIFLPLFLRTEKVFIIATGIIGITDEFLNAGLNRAKRVKTDFDSVFPLAYLKNQFSENEFVLAEKFWTDMGIGINDKIVRICFFGTLGYQFDFETVLEAAEELSKESISVQIIICGNGDKFTTLKKKAANLKNVILPGYMNAAQIGVLLKVSDIGLCPYYPNPAFLKSIPGKAIEYMSAGLPLLSTLEKGVLGRIITHNDIGYHYDCGNTNSLINAIKQIVNEAAILKIKHKVITKIFSEEFDAQVVYKQYTDHLEKVVILFQ